MTENNFSVKKPLFLYDDRGNELNLIVLDIIGASEKNLFVSVQYIINDYVSKNEDGIWDSEELVKNEAFEILINRDGYSLNENTFSFIASNFYKDLFSTNMYGNKNRYKAKDFTPPTIKCEIPKSWL